MLRLVLMLAVLAALVLPLASEGQEPILNVCDFPITVEPSRDKEVLRELPGGAKAPFLASVTGQFFVVLTNLDTGKSIEVNVSGPIFFTENGVILTGASLFFFPSPPLEVTGDIPVGLILTAGPVLVTGEGNTVNTELLGGRIRADLCDALADP